VTITGTSFCNGLAGVKFDSLDATNVTLVSDTTVTAVSPANLAGTVDVTVTTAGGTSPPSNADRFTYVSQGPCTSATLAATTPSPQAPGTTITFIPSSTGCTNPQYEFYVQYPNSTAWLIAQPYGSTRWLWPTAGRAIGVWGVGLWARQAGSTRSHDTYWLGTFTLSVQTCTAAAMSTVTTSPQPPGGTISFTASAVRCPGAQFRFWMLPPGGAWTSMQDFGGDTWTWTTTGLATGTYQLGVWAREPGSPKSHDAIGFTTFVLGTAGCVTAGLSPSVSTPQPPGTSITFTASSSTCNTPHYQFWLMPPGGGWLIKLPFGPSTTWTWNTTGYAAGTYQVGVWVKQAGSTATHDAYFIGTYQLDVGACTAATISVSPSSPQLPKTVVTFTATAVGCTTPSYEFWYLAPGFNWVVARHFSTDPTWNAAGQVPANYRVGVWVLQAGSTNSHDSNAIIMFWVGT
jgi:hypothetical protein